MYMQKATNSYIFAIIICPFWLISLTTASVELTTSPFEEREGVFVKKSDSYQDTTEKINPGHIGQKNGNEGNGKCELQSLERKFPDNGNCSRYFIQCIGGKFNENSQFPLIPNSNLSWSSCPEGKYFDSIDAECIGKDEAHCGAYICTALGVFPDPKNPSKYIHCLKDGPKRLPCQPEGTVFSSNFNICGRKIMDYSIVFKLTKWTVWLIQATEGTSGSLQEVPDENNGTLFNHPGFCEEDIIKIVLTAILFPLMYIATILLSYLKFHGTCSTKDDPFISDAEEFHRYFTRPTGGSATPNGNGIEMPNLYQTSSTLQCVRGVDGHYATTRM